MNIIDKIRNLLDLKFVKAFRLSAEDAKNLVLEFDAIKRDLASFENIAAERIGRAKRAINDLNLLQIRMNKKVDDFNDLSIENQNLKGRIAGFDMVLAKRDSCISELRAEVDGLKLKNNRIVDAFNKFKEDSALMSSKNRQESAPVKPEINISSIIDAVSKIGTTSAIIFLKDFEDGN